MDGECMDAARKFGRERGIDRTVSFDAALAAERLRHDMNTVMRLSAGAMPGMTSMQMRLVVDAEAFGRESFRQFLCDDIFRSHVLDPTRHRTPNNLKTGSISEMSSLEPLAAFFAYS